MTRNQRRLTGYLLAVVAIGAVWEGASLLLGQGMLGQSVLPSPRVALPAFAHALTTADFWNHFLTSGARVGGALVIAFGVGFPLGVCMGASTRLDALLSPLVSLTYPIPKIVLLPVMLLVLGIGEASKVAMIALIVGYQVIVTTRDGVRGLDRRLVDSVRTLGATRPDLLREVFVPAGLPHGFTALRLSVGVSVAVLFFVESFATRTGLGFLIMDGWSAFDFSAMFTGILGMSLLGVILYEMIEILERMVCRWRTC